MPAALRLAALLGTCLFAMTAAANQPGNADDVAQRRLHDDFEGTDFSPSSGLYYKDNKEQRAGRYRMQPEVVSRGKGAIELSVVPQCKRGGGKCSERAEVWEQPDVRAPYHATLWYAFSMRLDDTPPTADHRFVVAQWKRAINPGARVDYSPFFAIRIVKGHFALTIDSDAMPAQPRSKDTAPLACPGDGAPAEQRSQVEQTRLLVAASDGAEPMLAETYTACARDVRVVRRAAAFPKADARWNDFVFKIKPGPDGDGEIEVLANGVWIASVQGRIGHQGPDLGTYQYFKFGPYRDGGLMDHWRLFFDDFRRGPTCRDVAAPEVCALLPGKPAL